MTSSNTGRPSVALVASESEGILQSIPAGMRSIGQQTKRNVVTADVQHWIDGHRDLLRKLERRWGMSGGENWHNPDTGHFSIELILGEAHLKASREASARG